MAIGIGATIGAGINVYRNWDAISKSGNINWEKLAGFAAVGAIEGGFIAAAPGAGFTRVAASTFGRAIIGGTFKNIGNGILGGHVDSPKSFLFNSTIGAVTAGTLSGIGSILKGGNFFTGARVVPGEVIVGQVEKEVVKESGEKALEWIDDFAGRKAGDIAKSGQTAYDQALRELGEQAITVFHKGNLNGGVVSTTKTLSVGTSRSSVESLNRAGKVWEFKIPQKVFNQWKSQNLVQSFRDYDFVTKIYNEEFRFSHTLANELNKYLIK